MANDLNEALARFNVLPDDAVRSGRSAITRICRESKSHELDMGSGSAIFASCVARECQGRRRDMREPSIWPADEDERREAIEETFQDLARMGLIYDTGRRRWSNRRRQYQIVWRASHRCNCGCDAEECLIRDCPYKHVALDDGASIQ